MAKKWTNERVDGWLKDNQKTFARTSDLSMIAQPSTSQVEWKCSIDGHQWTARVDNIVGKGSGCPKCGGNVELTLDILNERIRVRSEAKCLEIYPGSYLNSRRGKFECFKYKDTMDLKRTIASKQQRDFVMLTSIPQINDFVNRFQQ